MKVFQSIPELASLNTPLSLAVGVFDGVHLGHRAVIASALEDARTVGGTAVVVTFEPHPVRVLRPEKAPRILASLPHKVLLLERLGVDNLLIVAFDLVFAQLPADAFIGQLVEASRELASISVGSGWRFGAGRTGNVASLVRLGEVHGFRVHPINPVMLDGRPVSSTRIRAAITTGDLVTARRMLGRDYTVLGRVVTGDQLGRQIGFPTANLRVLEEQLPPDGVYAVRAFLAGRPVDGVANVGIRPTVAGKGHHFEIHLLDFDEEIYGEELEITFVAFLRREEKFDDLDALRQQISQDCALARERLAHEAGS